MPRQSDRGKEATALQSYLVTLLAASFITALIRILSQNKEGSDISKYIKLLTSLFLVCVLIVPLQSVVEKLQSFRNNTAEIPGIELPEENAYRNQLEAALDQASTTYFTQMLTQMLETQFSVETGELRCTVQWKQENGTLSPVRVTVILSGKAIWKDPKQIEAFVSDLLGCECVSAIE